MKRVMPINCQFEENLQLKTVDADSLSVLLHLGHAYEAEFSAITTKVPDDQGFFHLDTPPEAPYTSYLFYQGATPIGFCIVNTVSSPMDVAEFYVIPAKRKQRIGMRYAHAIFDRHVGSWQVRQIQGADHALHFWRQVIATYSENCYKEEIVHDHDWGMVTRQTFSSRQQKTMADKEGNIILLTRV